MAIVIPIRVSGEEAEAELKKWKAEIEAKLGIEIKVDSQAAKEGLEEVQDEVSSLSQIAEKMRLTQVMEYAVDKIGDVKDILEKSGGALLGFSDATVDTIVSVGDLAEKGASLGAAFGPWGALAGAAAGAVVGYFTATAEQAEAAAEEVKKAEAELSDIRTTAREARDEMGNLEDVDLSSVIEQVKTLDQRLRDAKTGSQETQQAITELGEKGVQALVTQLAGLSRDVSGKSKFNVEEMGLSALQDELKAAERALAQVGTESDALASKIQDQGIAWYGTAEGMDSANDSLRNLNQRKQEAREKIDAYTAAILALKGPLEEETKTVKAHTAAVKEDTETISEWLDRTYNKARDARQAIKDFNQEVLDSLIKDAGGTDPQRDPQARGIMDGGNRAGALVPGNKEEQAAAQAAYDESVQMYASYVGLITSLTGELTGQLEANVAAGEDLFNGFGAAAERGVSQVLKALGREFSVRAIGEAAAALATFGTPASAKHAAAAIGYGAAAALAGAAGGALGGDATRRVNEATAQDAGGGPSASGGVGGSAANRFTDPGPTVLPNVTVIFNGPVVSTGEDAKAQLGGVIKEALDAHDNAGPSLSRRG